MIAAFQSSAAPPDGPVVQSVRVGFRVLHVATLLLAIGWATANIRPVPPSNQAVVLRFGQVVRVQPAGLVLAWPRPLERVVLLPSGAQQMVLKIAARTAQIPGIALDFGAASPMPEDAGSYLTGDGGVVLLDASLTWRISDAAAYYLSEAHVAAALRRLFLASTVAVSAGRPLDDFLAVRPEHATDAASEAARQALRGDLVAAVNARLSALAAAGAGLGVEVTRADVTALLPPAAKIAFDAVLEAGQRADQGIATARTEAERSRQQAQRESGRLLAEARAAAAERVATARTDVAAIVALESHADAASRPSLLDQVYRERIARILRQAGSVTTVDPLGGGRLILPAPGK